MSDFTRTGARRAGDDYQDIVALRALVEWLEHPGRFLWIRIEADDFGSLDDVVVACADGSVLATQVKFSTDPDGRTDPYCWADLVEGNTSPKGKVLPSLLAKWGGSLGKLRESGTRVSGALVSNRLAGRDLSACLRPDGLVDLGRVPDQEVRAEVVRQLGGEEEARAFFAAFRFDLDQADLEHMESALRRRFLSLHGDDLGWQNLKDSLRSWMRDRTRPAPGGRITLEAIRAAAGWKSLQSLPEDFPVPDDFVIPDQEFHSALMERLTAPGGGRCVVLAGPPGIGKSTYLSALCRALNGHRARVIRHHYFLSFADPTPLRFDHAKVALSLMSELEPVFAATGAPVPKENPRPEDLPAWIRDCGRALSQQNSRLFVVLDGLDHIWTEANSADELGKLFQLLTPVPSEAVLVIGTQPIDASRLPNRLSRAAPREDWIKLPALDRWAVRLWTEAHAGDLRATRDGKPDPVLLNNLAEAFLQKSEGYPLHLRYMLKSLQGKAHISAYDVEQLPALPHRDINAYYAELWGQLDAPSKSVLVLLATCDLPWTRGALAECLGPGGQGLGIQDSISRVAHLTSDGPAGLQFAHSSLQAFVRRHHDFDCLAPQVRELALGWLGARAPSSMRWSYEWLVAAEAGDDSGLFSGPCRDWLVDGMARGYPARIALRILDRSARCAVLRDDLARFVEVALLADYLSAVDDRGAQAGSLFEAQLIAREDPDLARRALNDAKSLGDLELTALAEAHFAADDPGSVQRCFEELNSRLGAPGGATDGFDGPSRSARCLARVAAIAPQATPDGVAAWAATFEPGVGARLWADYTDSLRRHGPVGRLRAAVAASAGTPMLRNAALSQLSLLACETGSALGDASGDGPEALNPLAAIAQFLSRNEPESRLRVAEPEPWVLGLKEYEMYRHREGLTAYFRELFFAFAANYLVGDPAAGERLKAAFAGRAWVAEFVSRLARAASGAAGALRAGAAIGFGSLFEHFSDLPGPEAAGREGWEFSRAAEGALCGISLDLQSLRAGSHPPRIGAADMDAAAGSPLFSLPVWLDVTAAYGRAWLTPDGLARALALTEGRLESRVEEFGIRAEICASAAALAAQNGDATSASAWVRRAWSNLLAYGYHKDMLLDQCLEAARCLQPAGFAAEALPILRSLTPLIGAVEEYTDGDEVGHLPGRLGQCLLGCDPGSFANFYRWLCTSGDYRNAMRAFTHFASSSRLDGPHARALAATAVENENLLALQERAAAGDADAAGCLRELLPFTARPARPESGLAPEREASASPRPDPAEHPPSSYAAYAECIGPRYERGHQGALAAWAKHWKEHVGAEAVLQTLEQHYGQEAWLSAAGPQVSFELTREARGDGAAFGCLVALSASNHCWTSYFSGKGTAGFVWSRLKSLYPGRVGEFLALTLAGASAESEARPATARLLVARLAEFLLFVGRKDAALAVAREAAASARRFVPLVLPSPEWTADAVPPDSQWLGVLLLRLTWPSPSVRERAAAALAALIARPDTHAESLAALLGWMEAQGLESLTATGLLVLCRAKALGARIPDRDALTGRLGRPSLLSHELLSCLYGPAAVAPETSQMHSGTAPPGFCAQLFFSKYMGHFLPATFGKRAAVLDRDGAVGFLGQWAFEWSALVARSRTPLQAPFLSYWMRRDEEHLPCFDLPLSEVYRSSYLRAVAWAADLGLLDNPTAQLLAAATCPADLGLWAVGPGARPVDWPALAERVGAIDSAPDSIAGAVRALWDRRLDSDWSVGVQSGLVHEDENAAYDLEIVGVIQRCDGPAVPDGDSLCPGPGFRIAEDPGSLVTFGGVYPGEPPSAAAERAGDWCLWRLAAWADPNTTPRWQWWRLWRGVWLPAPFLARSEFSFRCVAGAVVVEEDGREVARWADWSDGLRELALANLPPSCGSRLLLRRSLVERHAAALGGSYAWLVRIDAFHRKRAYEAFKKTTHTLDIGMTRVIRSGGR